MKKIICGLILVAMVSVTGAVQAATIFKDDKVQYDIKFDLQLQWRHEARVNEDLDLEYDDTEFKNSIVYTLTDNWRALGQLDFGFKNAADSDDGRGNQADPPHLEEAWVGFGYKNWTFVMGKRFGAGDHFGVQGSLETTIADDAVYAWGGDKLDDGIWVEGRKLGGGMVTVEASYEHAGDSNAAGVRGEENGTWLDSVVWVDLPANVRLGGMYQYRDADGDGPEDAFNIYGVQASWFLPFITVEGDWSAAEDRGSVMNVQVIFPKLPNGFSVGIGFVLQTRDSEFYGSNDDDITGWWANVIWFLPQQKNIRLFAEITGNDQEVDGEDTDTGYLTGMRVLF